MTVDDVAKILEETKYELSLLKKKDATGKEDGKVVGKSQAWQHISLV